MFEAVRETIAKKTVRHSKGREPVGRNDGRFGVQSAFADVSIHYHAGSPGPVVQMVRKRVKGRVDVFTGADIYFDKGDGGYYHDMTQEGKGEVTLSDAEYAEYIRISSKEGRSVKTTLLAKAEQSGKTKFVRNIEKKEESAGEESVREESIEEESTKEEGVKEESTEKEEPAEKSIVANADIFTDGTPMEHPPKAVRLYAEGDMRHAASLARAFEQPGKYGLFERLGEEMTVGGANPAGLAVGGASPAGLAAGGASPAGSAVGGANPAEPEVLVRATEYSSLDGLEGRYGKIIRGEIEKRVQEERLEASFGGSTGDMARKHTRPPKRQYDIIQATFFWLPGKTNKTNFMALKDFMRNQKDKLKEEGKIRIVLTDKDSCAKNDESENSYRWVADQLIQDSDLKDIYNVKMTFFKTTKPVVSKFSYRGAGAGQTYADKLSSLGMNGAGFKHTRTDAAETVTSHGDVMIEAKRKP